jgi:hypothetical protein
MPEDSSQVLEELVTFYASLDVMTKNGRVSSYRLVVDKGISCNFAE